MEVYFFLILLQLLKTCEEILSHIAMLSSESEYKYFINATLYHLTSLNRTLITVNNTVNGADFITYLLFYYFLFKMAFLK